MRRICMGSTRMSASGLCVPTGLALFVALLLSSATTSRADLATLSYSNATGQFTLSIPTSSGLLINTGIALDASVNMTAAVQGSATTITLNSTAQDPFINATVGFPVGSIHYIVGPVADGVRGRALATTIPIGSCSQLDDLPVLSAVREAFNALQTIREWENSPDSANWQRVINNLVLLFIGTDCVTDRDGLARPQDNLGCDKPFGSKSCHGGHG